MTSKILLRTLVGLILASQAMGADRVGHFDNVQLLDGAAHVSLQAPTGASTWTMLFPPNDGNADEVLTTDGAGVTSWAPQSDAVDSVNGQTGVVVLDTDDIAEGVAQYFTTERAQDAAGAALNDTASVDLTYNDGGNSIIADVLPAGVDKNLLGGSALSVANGGTGATTASGARTSLGAAASGANSDITSLSALSTPLSIAQGGTGQTAATAAFNGLDPLTTKGDLIVHNGTDSIRVGVGSNDQVLTADSTQASGVKWAASSAADPLGTVDFRDEFPTIGTGVGQVGELGWFSDSAGTAANVVRKSGVSGHPGIITLRPGTVGTGRACIGLGGDGVNNQVLGDGSVTSTWIVRSAQVLATFEMLVVGFGDTCNGVGDQPNGVYFQLLSTDINWQCVTANASTRTRVDTGVLYAINTWYKLKITVNAAGTSVQCNIDNVDTGAAITTNIPSAAISSLIKVDGIAAGVASDTDVDFFRSVKVLTTTR